MTTTGKRLVAMLVAAFALVLGSCGDPPEVRLVALSDEIQRVCGVLAARMVKEWKAMEAAGRRPLSFGEAELSYLDDSRARCQGALRLLDELDRERPRVDEPLESQLRSLVVVDRLLLESVVDPDMDAQAMFATASTYSDTYLLVRAQIERHRPLEDSDQQRIVGSLLPRWRELTPARVSP